MEPDGTPVPGAPTEVLSHCPPPGPASGTEASRPGAGGEGRGVPRPVCLTAAGTPVTGPWHVAVRRGHGRHFWHGHGGAPFPGGAAHLAMPGRYEVP